MVGSGSRGYLGVERGARVPEARDDGVPACLTYAATSAPEALAILIPAPGAGELAVVVDPGHDPELLWKQLQTFLKDEGIVHAQSLGPPAERRAT